MTKREKRLERIRQTVQGWTIDELEQIMLDYGIERFPGGKGSHRRYLYQLRGKEYYLTIPVHGKIKPEYVKRIRETIEEIIANDQ